MREIFTYGSVGGAPGNRCFYPEIWTRYRFVGDIKGFGPESITPIYCVGSKYEKRGLRMSIHAF